MKIIDLFKAIMAIMAIMALFEIEEIILLYVILSMRKEIMSQPYGVTPKIIIKDKSKIDRVMDKALSFSWIYFIFFAFAIFLFVLQKLDNSFFNGFYWAVLTSLLIPGIINILNNEIKADMFYNIIALVFLALFLTYFGQLEENEIYDKFKVYILAGYMSVFFYSIFVLIKAKREKEYFCSKLYKDLAYQIPNNKIYEYDIAELIKKCDKYFIDFLDKRRKVRDITDICFGTIYKRSSYYQKRINALVIVSVFILVGINMLLSWYLKQSSIPFCIISSILLITVYLIKRIDDKYFYRIFIRMFLGEWGCILVGNKLNYISLRKIGKWGKNNNFVESMLNFAAFFRAIAFSDRIHDTNKIQVIAEELIELTDMHGFQNDLDWIDMIPCIIVVLFSYEKSGKISMRAKDFFYDKQLYKSKREVECYLYGFWTEIKGRVLSKDDERLVDKFIMQIVRCN